MSVLHAFCRHFNIILIDFIDFYYQICSEIPCSIISRFAETSCLSFIAIQLTGCYIMRYLGVWNLGTDY